MSKIFNCKDCPKYQTNPYTGIPECYGIRCEVEIRADERRKFAEWLENNHFYIVEWKPIDKYSVNRSMESVLIKYEKEQNNENKWRKS